MDSSGQAARDDGLTYRSFRDVSLLGATPLLVPVVLAVIALAGAFRRNRVMLAAGALLFGLFTLLAGFSIGGAYVMPAGLLLIAAIASIDRVR